MAKERHLKNAPITEALIDFRVQLPKDFQVQKFSELKERLRQRYPKVEEQRLFQVHHEIKSGQTVLHPTKDMGIQGYFFKTEDERNIAQFRIDGFTLNRLKPYTNWRNLATEARSLWDIYTDTASPETITRLAVRYINQLKFPLPFDDFSDYLVAPPNLPPDLPQEVAGFLSRVNVYDSESNIAANITQALEGITSPDFVIIILDIDVSTQRDLPINDEETWGVLEKLHEMKNRIFSSSLTEKAVRLFE